MTVASHGVRRSIVFGVLLVSAGCGNAEIRIHKTAVEEGGTTGVTARLQGADDGTNVAFTVIEGQECGKLAAESANTAAGVATVMFTAATGVEDCAATIEAGVEGRSGRGTLFVNKLPLTRARIDGVSLLALFLIASFAIDRIVRGTLFALSYAPAWRSLVPDTTAGPPAKNERLAYVLMAGVLAVIVLGWFGKVRMLAALGFTQTHPILDTLFTGLLLVGGADRVEGFLDKIGGGAGGGPAAQAAKPVEITGRLVLEDAQRTQPSSMSSLPGGLSMGA
jgi:hypothetical protein